jgi:hypothetical protein
MACSYFSNALIMPAPALSYDFSGDPMYKVFGVPIFRASSHQTRQFDLPCSEMSENRPLVRNSTNTQLSQQQSKKINLPAEIRIAIYDLLLVSHDTIHPNVHAILNDVKLVEQLGMPFLALPHEKVLSIARTCTRARDEVLPVYFGSNKFLFEDTWSMYAYLYMIGDRSRLNRRLSFVYQGSYRIEAFKQLSKCMSLNQLHVLVLDATMKGSAEPRYDLFTAIGMQNLRDIRGLVGCTVIVREVRLIYYMLEWIYIWLPDQYSYENITKAERVLNLEIQQNVNSTQNNTDSNSRGYSARSATQSAKP